MANKKRIGEIVHNRTACMPVFRENIAGGRSRAWCSMWRGECEIATKFRENSDQVDDATLLWDMSDLIVKLNGPNRGDLTVRR